jgi:hypothetical protein
MFDIKTDVPVPINTCALRGRPRHSRHSMMRGAAMDLKAGESFQVPCASESDKEATIRALNRFKKEHSLRITIVRTGIASFGVWGQ